jgi:hypothetical protein
MMTSPLRWGLSARTAARFVTWYGTKEDTDTETVEVEKSGLSGGNPFKKDSFNDCVLRLMAQVHGVEAEARPVDHASAALCAVSLRRGSSLAMHSGRADVVHRFILVWHVKRSSPDVTL